MSGEPPPLKIKQYTISPVFFEKGFPYGGGPCRCTSVCCEGGVYVDIKEREKILAHKDIIKSYMDDTQSRDELHWFETTEHEDSDFASGRCVGTREINDKCAFLDKEGRCTLQVAAVGEGMNKWTLKPLFSILYPIEITNRFIDFDDMLQDEEACCSLQEDFDIPLFEACREELIHLIGNDGYGEMQKYYAANKKPQKPISRMQWGKP